MTDTLNEAKRLLDGITPGEWQWRNDATYPGRYAWSIQPGVLMAEGTDGTPGGDEIDRANAAFIAAAPRLVRDLVAEVEELRAALKRNTLPGY